MERFSLEIQMSLCPLPGNSIVDMRRKVKEGDIRLSP